MSILDHDKTKEVIERIASHCVVKDIRPEITEFCQLIYDAGYADGKFLGAMKTMDIFTRQENKNALASEDEQEHS